MLQFCRHLSFLSDDREIYPEFSFLQILVGTKSNDILELSENHVWRIINKGHGEGDLIGLATHPTQACRIDFGAIHVTFDSIAAAIDLTALNDDGFLMTTTVAHC